MPRLFAGPWIRTIAALCFLALMCAGAAVFHPQETFSAGSSSSFGGYLWSDTIGWIDLNCSNTNSCASRSFGLSMDNGGIFSGYAWSDNIGWVSANASDVTSCGSQPRLSGATLTGWLRALSGNTAQAGGWDGCISLAGSGYGVTLNSTNGTLSGYGWGSTNVGWVDFSRATLGAGACVPQNVCVGNAYSYQNGYCQVTTIKQCTGTCTPGGCSEDLIPPSGTIRATPIIVKSGGTTTVTWSSLNGTSCTITGSNGDSWSGTSGTRTSSPITDTTNFTLTCSGGGGTNVQVAQVKVYLIPSYHEF